MDKITDRIRQFNKDRDIQKLSLKYSAMTKSLFRFFRGSSHIYWQDMASMGLVLISPLIWGCGDLHLENFGSYKGDNNLVYFDLNDFDDAALMPAHWELSRMLSSILVAFQSLEIEQRKAEKLSLMFVNTYRETLVNGKAVYIERQTAEGIVCDFLKQVENRKYRELLKKKTHKHLTEIQILLDERKHLSLDKGFKDRLLSHVQNWLEKDEVTPYNYQIIDASFRVAGTGSLGLKRYVLLLKSSNDKGAKYLLLDMKEAAPSAAEPYLKVEQPNFGSTAQRVIELQKRMQNVSPRLLSFVNFEGKEYIIEELQPESDSINFKLLKGRYRDMCRVIMDMARLTASAQLRSASRQGSASIDDLIVFAKDDTWQKPLLDYSLNAALQTKIYYEEFRQHSRELMLQPIHTV